MPPKVKVSGEEIINAAVELVRKNGEASLNARVLSAEIGCSTQPVFSNFATMEDLRLAVIKRADLLCQEYMAREVESGEFPPYKAHGMAYIRFAKEEKELFRLLYMRDRRDENLNENAEHLGKMLELIKSNTGFGEDEAKLFHLEIWAYVHGIATMFATGYFNIDSELVSRMLTDAYQGLRKQYGLEG